jgi:hypothetical protein
METSVRYAAPLPIGSTGIDAAKRAYKYLDIAVPMVQTGNIVAISLGAEDDPFSEGNPSGLRGSPSKC